MKLDRDAREKLWEKHSRSVYFAGQFMDREGFNALLSDIERQMVPEGKELLGAIARGWCHPLNEKKEFDSDLAIAIAAEVNALLVAPSAPLSSAPEQASPSVAPADSEYGSAVGSALAAEPAGVTREITFKTADLRRRELSTIIDADPAEPESETPLPETLAGRLPEDAKVCDAASVRNLERALAMAQADASHARQANANYRRENEIAVKQLAMAMETLNAEYDCLLVADRPAFTAEYLRARIAEIKKVSEI